MISFSSLTYQHLVQCLACNKCSIKINLLIREQISGTKMNIASSFLLGGGQELAGFLQ